MERLASCVKDSLDPHYRVATKVKPPAASAGLVSFWMVTVDTTVGRRDISPRSILRSRWPFGTHDAHPLPLRVNYPQPDASYADIILQVESLDEIMADKVMADKVQAFVCSPHTQYRDLWDLNWLSRMSLVDVSPAVELRHPKEGDYRKQSIYQGRYPLVFDRIHHALSDSTAFTTEMSRFLPSAVRKKTVDQGIWVQAMESTLTNIFSAFPPDSMTIPG